MEMIDSLHEIKSKTVRIGDLKFFMSQDRVELGSDSSTTINIHKEKFQEMINEFNKFHSK